jgi:hypothetical protein
MRVYIDVSNRGLSRIFFDTLCIIESPPIEYPTNIAKVIEMDIILNIPSEK